MKLWEIFSFEVGYQARRLWTWVFFVALSGLSLQIAMEVYTENARVGGYAFNGPFVIASITALSSVMALLVTATFAGDAGARDVQTRMHPLFYTSPINKITYLGGRFLAAFTLNALILVAIPFALLIAARMPGVAADILGPSQPGAYFSAYLLIGLGNAFVATAFLFSIVALSRRAMAGYLGAVVLFFTSFVVWQFLAGVFGYWKLAKIIDPLAITVMSEISKTTTPLQKNSFSIGLNPSLLLNRAVWVSLAVGILAFAHLRFRFTQAGSGVLRNFVFTRRGSLKNLVGTRSVPIIVPHFKRKFGGATRTHQTLAIAARSFREIVVSWGGLVLGALTMVLTLFGPMAMQHMGVPLLPTTLNVTNFLGSSGDVLGIIIPLLIVFYAGELVWRDRETRMGEIADALPVPDLGTVTRTVPGTCYGTGSLSGITSDYLRINSDPTRLLPLRDRAVRADFFRTPPAGTPPFRRAGVCCARAGEPEVHWAHGRAYCRCIHSPRLGVRFRAETSRIRGSSQMDVHGYARLRSIFGTVALVQALLGRVGAAAAGRGETVLGSGHGTRNCLTAQVGPSPADARDHWCGSGGSGPDNHARRFRLLQYQRAQFVRDQL